MNRVEYLTELMKRDVELIAIAEKDVKQMKINIGDQLKKAEEKCESYEEMYDELERERNKVKPENNEVLGKFIDETTFVSLDGTVYGY